MRKITQVAAHRRPPRIRVAFGSNPSSILADLLQIEMNQTEDNPVSSSGESTNFRFLSRRRQNSALFPFTDQFDCPEQDDPTAVGK